MTTQPPTDALRLVPVEPTHQMHYDGDRVLANAVKNGGSIFDTTKAIWKAMLAAAPASPLPGGGYFVPAMTFDHIAAILWSKGLGEYATTMSRNSIALPSAPTGEPK